MAPRTSRTHPLQVAWLGVGPGRIGLTFCPGKKGPSVHGAPWDRELAADLGVIRAAGASLVVTLMERHEFGLLAVPGLGEAVAAAGMEWLHLPIVDVSVPDAAFEARWPVWSSVLHARLLAGQTIVIHCRGGLGRTGLLAAALLVETGMGAGDAIAAVRAVRKGAVETSAQAAWVAGRRALGGDPLWRSRVAGCLLGGAVGDAFGYRVEFKKLAAIRAMYGPEGLTDPDGPLAVSDDTQMTLFTAAGILAAPGPSDVTMEAVRAATLAWATTQRGGGPGPEARGLSRFAELWKAQAPGNTCLSACAKGAVGTVDAPINDSKGCGGVMRVAPFGLDGEVRPELAFNRAEAAAAQTHGHPSGYLSAGALAAMIRLLMQGADIGTAAALACDLARPRRGAGETVAALEAALCLPAARGPGATHPLGQGWVGEEALAIAVHAALHGRDCAEVLQTAANHDGDSDSTALIAGQIWGARHGAAGIPVRWIAALDVLAPLAEVLAGLADQAPEARQTGPHMP